MTTIESHFLIGYLTGSNNFSIRCFLRCSYDVTKYTLYIDEIPNELDQKTSFNEMIYVESQNIKFDKTTITYTDDDQNYIFELDSIFQKEYNIFRHLVNELRNMENTN